MRVKLKFSTDLVLVRANLGSLNEFSNPY
jgi:hypothetical protein